MDQGIGERAAVVEDLFGSSIAWVPGPSSGLCQDRLGRVRPSCGEKARGKRLKKREGRRKVSVYRISWQSAEV